MLTPQDQQELDETRINVRVRQTWLRTAREDPLHRRVCLLNAAIWPSGVIAVYAVVGRYYLTGLQWLLIIALAVALGWGIGDLMWAVTVRRVRRETITLEQRCRELEAKDTD